MALSDSPPSPPSLRGRRSCELHPPGPPLLHCGLPWLTCRAHYPGGPNRCKCRLLPGSCGLPVSQAGRRPQFHFRGLLRLTARYGLPACSPGFLRTSSRGFREADYPTKPLVSFHAYRQLHRWAPSSHRVSAPKRRTEKCWLAALRRATGGIRSSGQRDFPRNNARAYSWQQNHTLGFNEETFLVSGIDLLGLLYAGRKRIPLQHARAAKENALPDSCAFQRSDDP